MNQTDENNQNDSNSGNGDLRWYAVYTRPRFEKKVDLELKRRGFDSYLPLHTVVKQWSDRKKKVEEPLFRSYVFVHVSPKERVDSMEITGIVRMIGFGGKPSVIPDDQIDAIRRFLEGGYKIESYDYLSSGDPVEITHGPLMGIKGILAEKRNVSRFVIRIDAIGQSIAIEVDPGALKKL